MALISRTNKTGDYLFWDLSTNQVGAVALAVATSLDLTGNKCLVILHVWMWVLMQKYEFHVARLFSFLIVVECQRGPRGRSSVNPLSSNSSIS